MYWKCLVLSYLLVSIATWSGVKGQDDAGIRAGPATKDAQKPPEAGNTVDHAPAGQAMSRVGGPRQQDGGPAETIFNSDNKVFMVTVGAAGLAGFLGILMAGVFYYKFRSESNATMEVEYPAYGPGGPKGNTTQSKERVPSPGDRKLAQSAQMYHYQHQKQQMIAAMEKASGETKQDSSYDDDSEEDNTEGDYTVYECPGLAPTGEMEVKNPLFRGDDDMTLTPDDTDVTNDVTTLQRRTSAGDMPQDEEL